MNESANIIAKEVVGGNTSLLQCGGRSYVIRPFTINSICRIFGLGRLDKVKVNEAYKTGQAGDMWGMITGLLHTSATQMEVIAQAIVAGKRFRFFRLLFIRRVVGECTPAQLHDNMNEILRMANVADFFQSAALMSGAAQMIGEQKETEQ